MSDTASTSGNRTLSSAKAAKQDEFYTQLPDIANELKHYKEHFRGKVVLCNCDDPYESNFFQYFALNFNTLGLKKLICTSFLPSPIVGTLFDPMVMEGLKPYGKQKKAYLMEFTEIPDFNRDGAINQEDIDHLLLHDKNVSRPLKQGGDFRSPECVEVLKQADIVVTNPPFSLFREYVALLVEHGKQFLIIGNTNAAHYQEIFKLIKEDQFRTGYTMFNVGMFFLVPNDWGHYHHIDDKTGRKVARVSTSCWWTNMAVAKHQDFIPIFKKYSPEEYPKYDNLDAIEVARVADIPCDYVGLMGVPDTFLDKFNPDQFELIGIPFGNLGKEIGVTKNYRGRTDIAITKDGKSRCPYSRIIIRRRPDRS